MGKPASKPACTSAILPSTVGTTETFVYQCVYAAGALEHFRVYARKHVTTMPKLLTDKLLIQSALTLVNPDAAPVYKQYPSWG